jgi:hypothetical protein
MVTEKKCRTALEILKEKANGETVDAVICFKELIAEHFEMLSQLKTGDLSDGYHTYNELYHHRAVLFSIIVNQNKEIAWKSKKHHDGTMYDGMFIVGIDTPQGQYSYHYDIEPYWNMFECKELDNAPVWDGHEPKDINRLLSIDDNPPLKFEELKENMWVWDNYWEEYFEISEVYLNTKEIDVLIHQNKINQKRYETIKYTPNRFYRKEVVQND